MKKINPEHLFLSLSERSESGPILRFAGFILCSFCASLFLSATVIAGPDENNHRGRVPERRLLYQTDSWLIRGRAEVEYRYGPLESQARRLPYDNTNAEGRRQYRQAAKREILSLSSSLRIRLMPDYDMRSYIDPASRQPLRAVRWKSGFPDVLLDFQQGSGTLFLTRAEPVSGGIMERIGGWFQRSQPGEQPQFELLGPYGPLAVGSDLIDLMTVLYRLEEKFTGNPHAPTETFYISAMRKDPSNIYVGRFEPVERRKISLEVNGEKITRKAVRCEVTLRYGVPVMPDADDTLESLAEEYMPDRPVREAIETIRTIIGAETMKEHGEKPFIMPVSMSVYNRIHDDDKDFRGPFGLSESVTLWVDEQLGIPLRAECRIYGISGAVLLTQSCDDYFRLLKP